MKNIAKGMGMDWSYQSRKLSNNKDRWGVAVIAIPFVDPHNTVSCILLRKLFGWLQTLQPNRVREDIRDKIIQYQNECDDVLWKYWTKQNTPNEIMPVMPPSSMRILMCMDKGHVVSMQPVPDDCVVFRTEDIPKQLREPGYFTISEFKNITYTALAELAKYAEQALLLRK